MPMKPGKGKVTNSCMDCGFPIVGTSFRCDACKAVRKKKLASARGQTAKKSRSVNRTFERPVTVTTEMLIVLADAKGEKVRAIAYDINRPVDLVQELLDRMKVDGRYERHLKVKQARLLDAVFR